MSWIERLTPSNTEEVRPGLFIKKTRNGYQQVHPVAWNGVIDWKRFFLGVNPIKHILIFVAIMLLAFGYYTSTKTCAEFQANPCEYLENYTTYCMQKNQNYNILWGEERDKNTISLPDNFKQVP